MMAILRRLFASLSSPSAALKDDIERRALKTFALGKANASPEAINAAKAQATFMIIEGA